MLKSNFIFAEQQNNINQTLFLRNNSILDLINKNIGDDNDNLGLQDMIENVESTDTNAGPMDTFTFRRLLSLILDEVNIESMRDLDPALSEQRGLQESPNGLYFPLRRDDSGENSKNQETRLKSQDPLKGKEKHKTHLVSNEGTKSFAENENIIKRVTLPVKSLERPGTDETPSNPTGIDETGSRLKEMHLEVDKHRAKLDEAKLSASIDSDL